MLESLALYQFRNHGDIQFDFELPHVAFIAPNGQGKTNLLEAIYVLSTGKSWRDVKTVETIQQGCVEASIQATINTDKYQLLLHGATKQLERNGKKRPFKDHLGSIPTILFCPEHIRLFSGSKDERVRFFDRFLCQVDPMYATTLALCQRAHRHKTATLRQLDPDLLSWDLIQDQLRPWNEILAQNLPTVWQYRQTTLEQLQPGLIQAHSQVAGKNEDLQIQIQSAEDCKADYESVLEFFTTQQRREVYARKNLLAPQRDDYLFLYRQTPLTKTASRGEERSILLALLRAQLELMQARLSVKPILLLDDVFSELDADRQGYLQRFCSKYQTFFTTTHVDHVDRFKEEIQIIKL